MFKRVRNRAKWFRSIKPGDISGGQFKNSLCFKAISVQLADYNKTLAKDKGLFIHAKYYPEVSCVTLVGVTLEERQKELVDCNFSNHWRKKLEKEGYDSSFGY